MSSGRSRNATTTLEAIEETHEGFVTDQPAAIKFE
jgi:hypothetical protein